MHYAFVFLVALCFAQSFALLMVSLAMGRLRETVRQLKETVRQLKEKQELGNENVKAMHKSMRSFDD